MLAPASLAGAEPGDGLAAQMIEGAQTTAADPG
jgi:hypothetical protein